MANKKERACKNCTHWYGDKFQSKFRGVLKYLGYCSSDKFKNDVVAVRELVEKVLVGKVVSSDFACKYHEFI